MSGSRRRASHAHRSGAAEQPRGRGVRSRLDDALRRGHRPGDRDAEGRRFLPARPPANLRGHPCRLRPGRTGRRDHRRRGAEAAPGPGRGRRAAVRLQPGRVRLHAGQRRLLGEDRRRSRAPSPPHRRRLADHGPGVLDPGGSEEGGRRGRGADVRGLARGREGRGRGHPNARGREHVAARADPPARERVRRRADRLRRPGPAPVGPPAGQPHRDRRPSRRREVLARHEPGPQRGRRRGHARRRRRPGHDVLPRDEPLGDRHAAPLRRGPRPMGQGPLGTGRDRGVDPHRRGGRGPPRGAPVHRRLRAT